MYKTYSLKLQDNSKNTQEYFQRLFVEAKWLHNDVLEKNDPFNYKTSQTNVTVKQRDGITRIEDFKHLSAAMREVLRISICTNIRILSTKKRQGNKVGKLKFKSFRNSIDLAKAQIRIGKNSIRFQKRSKYFKFRGLDQLPENCEICCATLIRRSSGIYLNICVKQQIKEIPKPTQNLGVDFGVSSDFIFSDGTKVNFDISHKIKILKSLHHELSRKTRGSKRYEKCRIKLNKYYEHLTNCKNDAANKLNCVLKKYNVYFQDEQLQNWSRQFGEKIQRSILGRVKLLLKQNTNNVMLDRFLPTTKQCLECSKVNAIKLSNRIYSCECGYSCDRDVHAARNMLRLSSVEYAAVERESDLFNDLKRLQSKHLAVKRETV